MNRMYRSIHFVSFSFFISLLIAIAPLDARAASTDTGLIWKVTSGNATAYVVGSIHVGTPDIYPMPAVIDEAFVRSQVLAVEIDMLDIDRGKVMRLMREHGRYPEDMTLTKAISKRTRNLLEERGYDLETLKHIRPWVLAWMIRGESDDERELKPQFGIDLHYQKRAKRRELPVKELESVEAQVKYFASLAPEDAESFLRSVLKEPDKGNKYIEMVIAYWRKGDVPVLELLLMTPLELFPFTDDIAKLFLWDRNILMADRVEEYLADGRTHFVVMGSMHTLGERGVIGLLRERGYQVERLMDPSEI